jgi:hypothetical protein
VKRNLSLKRETLAELSDTDLAVVNGAGPTYSACAVQTKFCISNIGECVTFAC